MRCAGLLLFLLIPLTLDATGPTPVVVDGLADLSGCDFSKGAPVALSGWWQFAPGELLSSREWATWAIAHSPLEMAVPGLWRDHRPASADLVVYGCGTYRLLLRLPVGTAPLKIRFTNLQSSSLIMLNGQPSGGRGRVSGQRETAVDFDLPFTVVIPGGLTEVEVLVQIANWHNGQGGGILADQLVGEAGVIDRYAMGGLVTEVVVSSLFLFMAVFTLILFLHQGRDWSLAVFAAVALGFAARQFFIGETLGYFFPWIPFDVVLRGQESPAWLICGLLSVYFSQVFPGRAWPWVTRALAGLGLGLTALVWLAPVEVFSAILPLTQIMVFATILNAAAVVVRAWRAGDRFAGVFAGVVALLALPAAIEAAFGGLALPQLAILGFLPFLLVQTLIVAKRFAHAAAEVQSLTVSNARLKQGDTAKTNFLANISHELRTPLTLIRAPVEAIQNGEYGPNLPNTHPVFSLIQTNANRLLGLLERLLQLTRLEGDAAVVLRPVEFLPIVRGYLSEFGTLAHQAGVELVSEFSPYPDPASPVVNLDLRTFETVFFNYLSNALKFTPRGGRITVSMAPIGTSRVRLAVLDTGRGIESEVLPSLFVAYRRVYDTERFGYEGHGIGLTLAREAARALGGDVGVTSTVGRGSCFWLDLPLTSEVPGVPFEPEPFPEALGLATRTEAPEFGAPGPAAHRILVVEDNPDLRQFLSAMLVGYEVILAADGEEGVARLGELPLPDLILCDIMMPRMGGRELFERTRLRSGLASVPFVFLTARDEPEVQLSLLHQGLVGYLVKPFSVRELRARVASVLTFRANQRRALEEKVLAAVRSQTPGPGRPDYPLGASPRELEVLQAVIAGKTDKEIAQLLGISTRTASNHVAALLRKTGLSSRQALSRRYS